MNFSFYTGNLHKVPDAPRRWPLLKPSISLQTFKKALDKRQEALIRLAQTSDAVCTATEATPASSLEIIATRKHEVIGETCRGRNDEIMEEDIGNENEIHVYIGEDKHEQAEFQDGEGTRRTDQNKRKREDSDICLQEMCQTDGLGATFKDEHGMVSRNKSPRRGSDVKFDTSMEGAAASYAGGEENCDAMDCDQVVNGHVKPSELIDTGLTVRNIIDLSEVQDRAVGLSRRSTEQNKLQSEREKLEVSITPRANNEESLKPSDQHGALRVVGGGDFEIASATEFRIINHKAMRKARLETRFKELQEKKHQLVQMLKQVLSCEEELKKRGQGSMQSAAAFRSPGEASQVTLAIVTQSGCRIGSELHSQRDLEDGELEYARHVSPSRQTPSSTHTNSHDGDVSVGLLPSSGSKVGRLADMSQHLSQDIQYAMAFL